MFLTVWTKDEGITDQEFKDGDIFQVHDDDWTPGAREIERWLVVQVPNYGGDWSELTASEYGVGPGNEGVVRRMRKYRLAYAPKLDPEELAAARDRDLPVQPITGRFDLTDIVRK